jgi:hypothetical protein
LFSMDEYVRRIQFNRIMRITSRKLGIGYEYNQQHARIPATRSVVDGHCSREEHLSHAFSLLYMIWCMVRATCILQEKYSAYTYIVAETRFWIRLKIWHPSYNCNFSTQEKYVQLAYISSKCWPNYTGVVTKLITIIFKSFWEQNHAQSASGNSENKITIIVDK